MSQAVRARPGGIMVEVLVDGWPREENGNEGLGGEVTSHGLRVGINVELRGVECVKMKYTAA